MSAQRTGLSGCFGGGARGSHAGLLLQRYLEDPVGSADHPTKRQLLHRRAREATHEAAALYAAAFARRLAVFGAGFPLQTPKHRRLAVGLGGSSPTEIGLTLHHTYGTPLIPGSAIKGLASHYAAPMLSPADHRVIFGAPDAQEAGHIVFHDAWIDPALLHANNETEGLLPDVLTPHHQDYNGGNAPEATDFDKPIPLSFLSVRGTFYFWLGCDDFTENGLDWLAETQRLVVTAIGDWGLGGKTSSGYGRLEDPSSATRAVSGQENTSRPGPNVARPTSSGLPPVNSYVDVAILAERSKSGGLRVRHESGMTGPITNWQAVPAEVVATGHLTLRVGVSKLDASFEFVTDDERAKRLKHSKAHKNGRSHDHNDKWRR